MDIRKFAVNPTGRLHLRGPDDALLYADGPDGKPDQSKPIAVLLYGPGSKQHARATAEQSNQFLNKLRRKGKTDQTPAERAAEAAAFLTACTAGWENMEYEDLKDEALSQAVYADISIGFIADQVSAYLKEWGNFTKASPTD